MSSPSPAKSPKRAGLADREVTGEFVDREGDRYYCIRNVDRMPPFFLSLISSDDHWMFVSSTGGLTAGRVSPDTALFPYVPVDRIHESLPHTGPCTIVRVSAGDTVRRWEPFNRAHDDRYETTRNLYKNTLGDRLCFEEINHDLGLTFRYTWSTSAEHGFVRDCELENLAASEARAEILDGLQNILPAGTPRYTQTNSSNLVDAYKWSELDEPSGLAFLTLYSGITDRAEPSESLRATTAYCLGLDKPTILLSSAQVGAFRKGAAVATEHLRRGIRGAYLTVHEAVLAAGSTSRWRIVLNAEQTQRQAVKLRQVLRTDDSLHERVSESIGAGSDKLARIMGSADAFQATAEENVAVHHYANVLFNVLRGGIVADQYNVPTADFRRTVHTFNRKVCDRNAVFLDSLPYLLRADELVETVRESGDPQLLRLALEYLPITFGRRHGDPSRPWNEFAIRLKDEKGDELLSYQGNWRDIFQNWEALAFSFPGFVENMIAKFVNASTLDGYNPYRITKHGIDWEVEEPDNPWSYIGYWGDHQIIYLLKLLELSQSFHPQKLHALLRQPAFCYANVPYRIKPLSELLLDPKDTVLFDQRIADLVDERVSAFGADGKLVLDDSGEVFQVNLLEKLLVPLLAKLGNLVIDGGIWLNTQRPEWNDANNALVGQGLSMVTLCYMRRYVSFLQDLLSREEGRFSVSQDVDQWITETAEALSALRPRLAETDNREALRFEALQALGSAAGRFRERVYTQVTVDGAMAERDMASIVTLLADAQAVIDHCIESNQRDDGLYHAYNIGEFDDERVGVRHLYPMLEGQVAALSAGTMAPDEAAGIVEALFASNIYREDQQSFMLYPDRDLPGFLDRNRVPEDRVRAIPLLERMLSRNDDRIIDWDADGCLRFNEEFRNENDLVATLDRLAAEDPNISEKDRTDVLDLYESVFRHSEFTGRSGTMFGFEGLGSIYWHMVSKLLLALAENYFEARDGGAEAATVQRLGELYYRVRAGIGFNKSPSEYGAFPTDPYSHTPKHAGARQPGMTGQVKEEVLTRFAELGIRVQDGRVSIDPVLLRACEFAAGPMSFQYLDIDNQWQTLELGENSLAFTWCQVPFVYRLGDGGSAELVVEFDDGSYQQTTGFTLPADVSASLFARDGRIRRITATLDPARLFPGQH